MKAFRSLIFLLFLSTLLPAQEYTIQQCIDIAVKNNLRLRQAKLGVQSSQVDVKQAGAAMLPNLNASFGENFNFGRNIDPVSNTYISNNTQSTNMGLNSSVTVFNGFQLLNNYKLSKLNLLAAGADALSQQNDLALQVAAAYLQVMYAEDNLENSKLQLELTKATKDRVKKFVEAGRLPESSLSEIDAQEANEEYNIQVAENGVVSAKLTLIQMMDLPVSTNYKISRPKVAIPAYGTYGVNSTYESALTTRPEIKAAEWRVQGAELSRKIAYGGVSPRLTFSAGFNTLYSSKYRAYAGSVLTGYTPIGFTKSTFDTVFAPSFTNKFNNVKFGDQLDQNFGQYMQLSLSVPIFNNLRVNSNIQKSKINIENQNLNLSIAKSNLLKGIQQAITDVEAAKAKYFSAQKNATFQNSNFDNAQKRYNEGVNSYVDYVTAKNSKARADINLSQSKYDLILKIKIIDFYLGKSLSF